MFKNMIIEKTKDKYDAINKFKGGLRRSSAFFRKRLHYNSTERYKIY